MGGKKKNKNPVKMKNRPGIIKKKKIEYIDTGSQVNKN